jgi:hypothetical protein
MLTWLSIIGGRAMDEDKYSKNINQNEILYKSTCDLIKHSDTQITQASQYYFTALGSLIPILAIFVNLKFHWSVHLGIILLAASLCMQWLSLTTKLTIQKKCWCETARKLESEIFTRSNMAPFSNQQEYFDNLREMGGTRIDSMMIDIIGSKYSRYISVCLLIFAMISVPIYLLFIDNIA